MLALASPLCQSRFDHLISSLYGFAKWLLVLSVTLFSGLLSVQTMLGAQVDAASSKAVKLLASSAIPIVGGAFGDAVAAIQNSVQIVKSGAGAFGILAALCIFAPTSEAAALTGHRHTSSRTARSRGRKTLLFRIRLTSLQGGNLP